MYRGWIDKIMTWRYQRHAFCGQGNYLNGMSNSLAQLQYAYNRGADGSVNYSYYATRSSETLCDGADAWVNDWSWYNYIATNLFTAPVPAPTMPWRDPATATEGTLWGRVTEFATGDPVDDATVWVSGQSSVKTDGNGYYTVTLIPATAQGSSRSITVSKTGLPGASHPGAVVLAGDLTRYDFSLGAPPPQIEVEPTLYEYILDWGNGLHLPEDSFTVSGLSGSAPLNYTISGDAAWLTVSPADGVSYGEADAITITYDVAGLTLGHYVGTIPVTDAAATNNPQTVTVDLWVLPPAKPCDFDRDGDVDQHDFGHIQVCLSGASNPQNDPDCQDAKLDGDNDVDADDVALFLGCVSGPDNPSDPACLEP